MSPLGRWILWLVEWDPKRKRLVLYKGHRRELARMFGVPISAVDRAKRGMRVQIVPEYRL